MIAPWPLVLLGAAAGAALGSYAATAALRWTRGEASVFGRSHCDTCGVGLGFARTVPVLSFVRAGGVCADCGAPVDRLHLWGELAGAAAGALSVATLQAPAAVLVAVLALVLVAAATADARALRLPDFLSFAAGLLGACLAWRRGGPAGLATGAAAAAVTFGMLALLMRVSARRGGVPGLGFGDVKLLSALALWLGIATPWAVAAAAMGGLAGMGLTRPADGRLAFGPYIAAAAWLTGLGGEWGWWPTTL